MSWATAAFRKTQVGNLGTTIGATFVFTVLLVALELNANFPNRRLSSTYEDNCNY